MPKKSTYRRRPMRRRRYGAKNKRSNLVERPSFPLKMADYVLKKGARTGDSVYALAQSVQKIAQMINTDKKVHYLDNVSQVVSSTPAFSLLNGIANGTDENSRIGNQILSKDLEMRFNLAKHASATTVFHRFVVFVDKEADGTTPTSAELFENTNYLQSPFNNDNRDRFIILWDMKVPLWTEKPILMWKKYVKLNFHIHFTGTTSAEADVQNNSIYMVRVSDQATNTSSLSFNSKLQYYDN